MFVLVVNKKGNKIEIVKERVTCFECTKRKHCDAFLNMDYEHFNSSNFGCASFVLNGSNRKNLVKWYEFLGNSKLCSNDNIYKNNYRTYNYVVNIINDLYEDAKYYKKF